MTAPDTVAQACAAVLTSATPRDKVVAARHAARAWRLGNLAPRFDIAMPDAPSHPDRPLLLAPRDMPKRGSAGSERARIALLHALAHIEFSAIDLAFDLIGRFGGDMPRAFIDDWMRVGAEEAVHFVLLDRRLRALGSHYGALPAHAGLWEAAATTRHDIAARLAVVPMVLEARGLDVTPQTIERLEKVGDARSVVILQRILRDEIGHVRAGTKWFNWTVIRRNGEPILTFQTLVSRHFRGMIKPPFNGSARDEAGLTCDFYNALAQ